MLVRLSEPDPLRDCVTEMVTDPERLRLKVAVTVGETERLTVRLGVLVTVALGEGGGVIV